MVLWWLGENRTCVQHYARAYALFRRSGDVEGAVQCAAHAVLAPFTAGNGSVQAPFDVNVVTARKP